MGLVRRALVTGHRGFVGTHLCDMLRADGYEVSGIDLREGKDICLATLPEADRVFHLAAQTNAQSRDAYRDAQTNILGSLRIFETYRERVVFASSSMVNYPASPYAISKQAGEHYARYYGAAVVRFCNLYGPGGHSVIDKFRNAERLTIYGSGEQLRTYAPVADAVDALLNAIPGETQVLLGDDCTVNQVAEMFHGKPVDRVPASPLDIMDGRQQI